MNSMMGITLLYYSRRKPTRAHPTNRSHQGIVKSQTFFCKTTARTAHTISDESHAVRIYEHNGSIFASKHHARGILYCTTKTITSIACKQQNLIWSEYNTRFGTERINVTIQKIKHVWIPCSVLRTLQTQNRLMGAKLCRHQMQKSLSVESSHKSVCSYKYAGKHVSALKKHSRVPGVTKYLSVVLHFVVNTVRVTPCASCHTQL